MKDVKLGWGTSILAALALWGFFGWLFYVLGTLARAALVG